MTRYARQTKWIAVGALAVAAANVFAAEPVVTHSQAVESVMPSATGRVVLYEFPNFTGAWVTVDRDQAAKDLDWANFRNSRNRATSVRVEAGTWMVCSEMAFQGDCRILGPGEYPQLPGSLVVGVSSARQV